MKKSINYVLDLPTKTLMTTQNFCQRWTAASEVEAEIEINVHSRKLIILRKYVKLAFFEALSGKNSDWLS